MITKERITHLRRSLERNPIDGDDVLSLLDAAEKAIALRAKLDEAIAWIDRERECMSDQAAEAAALLLARLRK